MVIHILNIVEMGLGIILIFFAAVLWSMFRRFSSALLALTALFVYASMILDLLDFYRIVDRDSLLMYKDIPILNYAPTFLIILAFIFTLFLFFKEERKLR